MLFRIQQCYEIWLRGCSWAIIVLQTGGERQWFYRFKLAPAGHRWRSGVRGLGELRVPEQEELLRQRSVLRFPLLKVVLREVVQRDFKRRLLVTQNVYYGGPNYT
jgi:hypothetical protein